MIVDEATVKDHFEAFATVEHAVYAVADPTVAAAFEQIFDLISRATLGPDHLAVLARVVGRFDAVRDAGRGLTPMWRRHG